MCAPRSAGGFTALLFAARRGDLRSARLLVARSANVDAAAADRNSPFLTQESPDGVTPLLMAVAANHQPLARFLLDQGADPTIPDAITKRTALHVAAEDGRDEMVRLLLERGADPNAQLVANPPPARGAFGQSTGLVGATPLYLAARAGDPTIMSMLIAHGADLGLATADGITPLMAAAGPSRLPGGLSDEESLLAVTLAVELGADVNARNQRGQTALHLAAMRGTDAIVELLGPQRRRHRRGGCTRRHAAEPGQQRQVGHPLDSRAPASAGRGRSAPLTQENDLSTVIELRVDGTGRDKARERCHSGAVSVPTNGIAASPAPRTTPLPSC